MASGTDLILDHVG